MKKLLWNALKVSPAIAATLFAANSAFAVEVNEQVTTVAQLSQEANSIGQVTSVSQFSDVQPTDWAFQALQSLVERYGCIAGYPNSTYRGNRALTRYEFAAGLNACLDRVNELIATATADVITRQDLATLQRLQEEFSAELATLRGRVDSLEARTAELEANQFSTTTKLKGEAIFALGGAFGDERVGGGDIQDNITFANRVRLNLESSFTGTDKLQVRLQARNIAQLDGGSSSRPNITGTNMTRLGFDGDNGNNVEISKVNYEFNLSDAVRVKVDASGAEIWNNTNVFNSNFSSSGSGSISRYGRFSPIYRASSPGGAGLTVTLNPKGAISFTGAYMAPSAEDPTDDNGLLNGANAFFGQIDFKPSQALNLGFTYSRTYQNPANGVNLFGSQGSAFANRPFGNTATSANNYSVQANFRPSSALSVGGWAGYTTAESEVADADADIFYWAANIGIRDFGREGNLLGVIFGQPPKVTGGSVDSESDTSYHLEGLYRMRLTENIAVTPGLLVIFNPEHNSNNETIYVGTLRTTFSF
ncbi:MULTISPECIES: iron uptake porin [unclassified Nodularia (in: cyanobacteria)]|uniref:iron uptake porin n=1 Tax=unclassified Nodularia (in: cyanobacteria) TaxID=2656917 RepID=UPI00187E8451|nr:MULTISPECIES: iron uptake porin [unclassified Nodularia (in: cyanobacteria)]MBE9198176.1 iron uptake porin [Nodularia sp. LEGE 06071]MCC2695310.1 iron uptake porin [Nodularia sp. LEGE 04288]